MKANTPTSSFLLTLVLLIVLSGCKKEPLEPFSSLKTLEGEPTTICCAPIGLQISPNNGPGTTLVTITNGTFGKNANTVEVFFNDKPARIVSLSNDIIVAEVPLRAGTGPVKVTANNQRYLGPTFTYTWITTVSTITFPGAFPYRLSIKGDKLYFTTLGEIWSASNIYSSSPVFQKIAGNGVGFQDGATGVAKFDTPWGMATDANGKLIIADGNNHRIRRIDLNSHLVSTLAGTGVPGFVNGTAAAAQFNLSMSGVAVDHLNNIYVADRLNNRIRKISPAGIVSTLAGSGVAGFANGMGTTAQFNYPRGIAVDFSGNVYVGDSYNNRIRKITPSGFVSTLAGSGTSGFADGPGASARFYGPDDIAIDSTGNLYVAEYDHRIRKVTPLGVVSTVAGNGTQGTADGEAGAARFTYPKGVAVDKEGNVWVADFQPGKLRKITIQ